VEYIQSWKVYGSLFFLTTPSTTNSPDHYPDQVIVGVCARGVMIINPANNLFLDIFPHSSISRTDGDSKKVSIVIAGSKNKITFRTERGDEISCWVREYQEMYSTLPEHATSSF